MPLPGSGQITWAMIQAEFGGSNPINISEYYRGGAYVPNTPTNAGVPTSGQISANQFYNTSAVSGPTVAMPNGTANSVDVTFGGCTAMIDVFANGTFAVSADTTASPSSGTWLTSGSSADVQVYVSKSGTGQTAGTFDTWLDCSTNRWWSVSDTNPSGAGTSSYTFTFTFRNKTTLATLDTATWSMYAESNTF